MSFVVTPQHAAIFSWVTDPQPPTRCMLIDAVAGSGKTATLIQILSLIPKAQSVIFLAFNKDAALEVEARARTAELARPGVTFKTLNALGHSAVVDRFGRIGVDSDVVDKLLRERMSKIDPKTGDNVPSDEYWLHAPTVRKLVAGAKSQGLVPDGVAAVSLLPDTDESWAGIVDQFSIDPPDNNPAHMPHAIEIARKALVARLQDMSVIDFDDQLYATVALSLPVRRFDWVLVDEAQDLNPVQRRMLAAAIASGGRLIAVGDPFQAIYQFRGATSSSMTAIANDYDGRTFPLSITYRCPLAVVGLAQEYVPHLTAAPIAPMGMIEHECDVDKVEWRADDMVLCRNNAPLVSLAYRLLRRRIKCRVAGREIGAGIRATIRSLKPYSVIDLASKLEAYADRESKRLTAARASEARMLALFDKVECIRVFTEEAKELDDIDAAIADLFDDKTAGRIVLSSVHKAKGQERDRVFILNPHLMPSSWVKTEEQKQSERNIIYVALTRARSTLVYISTDANHPIGAAPKPTKTARRAKKS